MKKLLGSLVALVLVGAVVATTALTDARWSQNDDRNLGEISLMAGSVDFDLAVTMLGNRTVVPSAAAPVEYTVRVHNHGPDDTRNMTVTFQVPLVDGLDLVSVTPQGSDAVCDLSEAATAQPTTPGHGLIVCTVAGPLQAGSTYEVLVEMYAQKALLVSSITATATVSAPRESPKLLGNNTASWLMAYPDPLVDLSILKTGPATVEAGRKAFYTLVVTNTPVLEMVTALPPTVVDTLPAGVTLLPSVVAGSLTPSWCVAAGQVVTCTLPASIPAGSSTTIELSVQFDASLAGTTVTNTATVFNDPTQPDPSLANNTWTATTVVTEGSGNEDICWGTWVGGVCVPDGPGDGGDGPIDLTAQPPLTWETASPGSTFVSSFPLGVVFHEGDTSAYLTIAVGQDWWTFISGGTLWGTNNNPAGQGNQAANGRIWDARVSIVINGVTTGPVAFNPDGTLTFPVPVTPGPLNVSINVHVQRAGGNGNNNSFIPPTWIAAALTVVDAGGERVVGPVARSTPAYAKQTPAPTLPTQWWNPGMTGGALFNLPSPTSGMSAPASAPLFEPVTALLDEATMCEHQVEGLWSDGHVPDGTVVATFDAEAMTFTLEDGTVLVVVEVHEDEGALTVTTEDGTAWTLLDQPDDDPGGT